MSDSWLAIAAIAAGALLLIFVLARVVSSVRARRNWVLPPEGTLEARLQAFAPLPAAAEESAEVAASSSATAPLAVPTAPATRELPPDATTTPTVSDQPSAEPPVPAPHRHNSVEVVADGVVIGVVEGSESHRRFRAAADELLADLKEARDASR